MSESGDNISSGGIRDSIPKSFSELDGARTLKPFPDSNVTTASYWSDYVSSEVLLLHGRAECESHATRR